jgi:predicted metal-dependent hydrolase
VTLALFPPIGGPPQEVAPHVDDADTSDVVVRRSRRRKRTVTAFREGGRTVVAIPDRFTRAQEREWVAKMVARLATQERRRRPSDAELAARAAALSARYLGGQARPTSVAWSDRQERRWGSCSVADGSIRISSRVRGMPGWVQDYVLLHELAHLLSAGHGPDFWALLEGYDRAERARGFLAGYSHACDVAGVPEGPGQPSPAAGEQPEEY